MTCWSATLTRSARWRIPLALVGLDTADRVPLRLGSLIRPHWVCIVMKARRRVKHAPSTIQKNSESALRALTARNAGCTIHPICCARLLKARMGPRFSLQHEELGMKTKLAAV